MTIQDVPEIDAEQWARWIDESPVPNADVIRLLDAQPDKPHWEEQFDRWWAWCVAGVAFVIYLALGIWLLYGLGYAIGDALARASSARSVVHSHDPHLMAVGFYWAPLPAYAESIFMAVFSRIGHPEWTLFVPTAAITACTIPVLASIAKSLRVRRRWSIALVVIFALNPYTLLFSANGMSEAWYVFFLALSCAGYLRWTRGQRTRDLAILSFTLALAQMTRHENVVVVLIFALAVAWQSPRGRRLWMMVATGIPAGFAFLVWTLTSIIIVREPWWKVIARSGAGQRITIRAISGDHTLANVGVFTASLVVRIAPGLLIAAVLAGVVREGFGQLRRSPDKRPALLSLPILLTAVFFPVEMGSFLLRYQSYGDVRYYMTAIVLVVVLSMVALRDGKTVPTRGLALVGVAVIGTITATGLLGDQKYGWVTGEWTLPHQLFGDQTIEPGAGIADFWRDGARDLDAVIRPGDSVTLDTAALAPIFLFTKHPTQITTDRDKDAEALLARANPGFTVAIFAANSDWPYNTAIQSMVRGGPPRGKQWVQVKPENPNPRAGLPEIWRLVFAETGQPATDAKNVDVNASAGPGTSATTTTTTPTESLANSGGIADRTPTPSTVTTVPSPPTTSGTSVAGRDEDLS